MGRQDSRLLPDALLIHTPLGNLSRRLRTSTGSTHSDITGAIVPMVNYSAGATNPFLSMETLSCSSWSAIYTKTRFAPVSRTARISTGGAAMRVICPQQKNGTGFTRTSFSPSSRLTGKLEWRPTAGSWPWRTKRI